MADKTKVLPNGRSGSNAVKAVPALTAEQAATQRLATGLAKDWQKPVLAAITVAEKADRETSGFIFDLIRQTTDVQAAKVAFEALEIEWQKANSTTVTETRGTKAGTEVTVKPNIPATWRVHKSAVLSLCKEGPELAGKVTGDVLFRAVKALHIGQDDIRKMYGIDGDRPMDYRADKYSGAKGLKAYRQDFRDLKRFLSTFGPKATGTGDSTASGVPLTPLPEQVVKANTDLSRTIRDAIEHGISADLVAGLLSTCKGQIEALVNAKVVQDREAGLAGQRADAKASALNLRDAEQGEPEEQDEAAAG